MQKALNPKTRGRGSTRSAKDPKASEFINESFESRMQDIRTLWKAEQEGGYFDDTYPLGTLSDYGLCLDFVEAGTFEEPLHPYYRYRISYGGPTEEFRIFLNGEVEFWYIPWFDGYCVQVKGEDAEVIRQIAEMCLDYDKNPICKDQNTKKENEPYTFKLDKAGNTIKRTKEDLYMDKYGDGIND